MLPAQRAELQKGRVSMRTGNLPLTKTIRSSHANHEASSIDIVQQQRKFGKVNLRQLHSRVARSRRRQSMALAPATGGGAGLPPLRELPPGKRLQLGRAYHGPPAIVLVVPVYPGDPRPAPAGSQGSVVPPGSGEAPSALQPPAPRTPPDPEKR